MTAPASAPFQLSTLTLRQWATFTAHCFKAITRQHHTELEPVFRRLIPPDGVVLDVGGHAGQFAKLFARIVPHGQVFSFEPGGYARAILEQTLRFTGKKNVTIVPFGLGDENTQLTLNVPVKASGSFGFGLSHMGTQEDRAYRSESVDVRRLDDVAGDLGIDRVDFIKVDIEGWELRMLNGALGMIEKFRPSIVAECVDSHLARAGDSMSAMWQFFDALGYLPFRFRSGALVPLKEPEQCDVFWLPREKAEFAN